MCNCPQIKKLADMTVRFAKLAQVTPREFSLDHTSTFWCDLADPATLSRWMGNVPGKYAGQSGYTTGFGRGRMPWPKYIAPNWRTTNEVADHA